MFSVHVTDIYETIHIYHHYQNMQKGYLNLNTWFDCMPAHLLSPTMILAEAQLILMNSSLFALPSI